MSSIKVIIQYNGKELTLDLEINEDNTYNTFIDIFRQKFREEDINKKFKLTSINTIIPYLIIDQNNISSILNEKTQKNEPLKILVTTEEDEEDKRRDNNYKKFSSGFIKGSHQDEDDFNDDDFVFLDENGNDYKSENINKMDNNDNKININDDFIEENKEDKEKELNKLLSDSLSNDKEENKININNDIIEPEKEKK